MDKPVDQYRHYNGKMVDAASLNFEAWSRTLIGFIRHKGLEQELRDWSGGWACPVGSDPKYPLAYAVTHDLVTAMDGIVHFSDALNFRNDHLSKALSQWIEAGRKALATASPHSAEQER